MAKKKKEFIDLAQNERRTISLLRGYWRLYDIDMDNYKLYKENKIEGEIPEYNMAEMKTLDTLSDLGFPMDHMGTYFYKDVIMATKPYLESIINEGIIEKYDYLKNVVDEPYNSFYLNISRGQNEMPLMDLHVGIMSAINNVNKDNINMSTVYEIFGAAGSVEHTYGQAAIKIGLYSFGMRSLGKITPCYDGPKLIKISDRIK